MKLDLEIDRLLLIDLPIAQHKAEFVRRLLEGELTKRLSGSDWLSSLRTGERPLIAGKTISVSGKASGSELVNSLADSIMTSLQVGDGGISEGGKNA